MHGVISRCSSCVLAQGLPEHSAVLPVAETPPPSPPPLPAPAPVGAWAASLGEWGLLVWPMVGGQEGEAGAGAAGESVWKGSAHCCGVTHQP